MMTTTIDTAEKGQAQSDVHGGLEEGILDDGKRLVVVQRNPGVRIGSRVGGEGRIRRPGPADLEALETVGLEDRPDDPFFLVTEKTSFTGMWIEAEDTNFGIRDPIPLAQGAGDGHQGGIEAPGIHEAGDIPQGHVGRDECDPKARGHEHHDRLWTPGFPSEIFGMPLEGESGIFEMGLVDRSRDEGPELAGQAARDSPVDRLEDIGGIGGFEMAGPDDGCQGEIQQRESVRRG